MPPRVRPELKPAALQLPNGTPVEQGSAAERPLAIPLVFRSDEIGDQENRCREPESCQNRLRDRAVVGVAVVEREDDRRRRGQAMLAAAAEVLVEPKYAAASEPEPPHLPGEPTGGNDVPSGPLAGCGDGVIKED